LSVCASTCSGGGVLGCYGSYSITVYTLPSVTSITNPSTVIYSNTSLTTPSNGIQFQQSGNVYDISGGTPTLLGSFGSPC
jgi:hypothetical protein